MNSIVVRGTLSDSRHIELAEPVQGLAGDIEVTIRAVSPAPGRDVFDVIATLAAGTRSKAEIDRDVRDGREQWAHR
jgi:hypothetical protein